MARTKTTSPMASGTAMIAAAGATKGNVNKLVNAALIAAKTTKQAIEQCEIAVKTACEACLAHFDKSGDAMPADRLVKGLHDLKHPAYTRMATEIAVWFNTYSPIRWKADGKVNVLKEGDEGYKAPDLEKGQETSFTETPQAKRARAQDSSNTKKMLKPLTLKDMLGRVQGLRNTFKSAQEADGNGDVRGVEAKDISKIKKLLNGLEEVAEKFAPAADKAEKKAA